MIIFVHVFSSYKKRCKILPYFFTEFEQTLFPNFSTFYSLCFLKFPNFFENADVFRKNSKVCHGLLEKWKKLAKSFLSKQIFNQSPFLVSEELNQWFLIEAFLIRGNCVYLRTDGKKSASWQLGSTTLDIRPTVSMTLSLVWSRSNYWKIIRTQVF